MDWAPLAKRATMRHRWTKEKAARPSRPRGPELQEPTGSLLLRRRGLRTERRLDLVEIVRHALADDRGHLGLRLFDDLLELANVGDGALEHLLRDLSLLG